VPQRFKEKQEPSSRSQRAPSFQTEPLGIVRKVMECSLTKNKVNRSFSKRGEIERIADALL
jgi:hypothetical protein